MRCLIPALLAIVPVSAQQPRPTLSVVSEAFSGASAEVFCYDEARQRLVHMDLSSGTIWEYDGNRWGRQAVQVPSNGFNVLVVYDHVRERILIAGTRLLEYDGHSIVSRGAAPRLDGLTVDSHRGKLVGFQQNGARFGLDIVEYDGLAWSTVAFVPGSTILTGAEFDRHRSETVFGAGFIPRFYKWDGANLSGPFGTSTNSRVGITGYDSTRQKIIGQQYGHIWAWEGTDWTQLPGPTTRIDGPSVFDSARGRIWAFDRSRPGGPIFRIWDGNWRDAMRSPHPADGSDADLIFDSERGVAVFMSRAQSQVGEFAEWDGWNWRWPDMAGGPQIGNGVRMEFDVVRGETVVFELDSGHTYTWNGVDWRLAATTGPPPRYSPAIAYDSNRGRVVLVGGVHHSGQSYPRDHWEWDGSSWTQVMTVVPDVRSSPTMGFDPLRNRLVLQHSTSWNTYEYDGVSWQSFSTSVRASPTLQRLVWNPNLNLLQAIMRDGGDRIFNWNGTSWSDSDAPVGQYVFDEANDRALIYRWDEALSYSTHPASTMEFGSGCGGSGTTTSLVAFRQPRVGDTDFHLDLRTDATFRPAVIGFDTVRASAPLGHGCTFLLRGSVANQVWFTDRAGYLHMPMPVPNLNALRGTVFYAQGAVLDPASPGNLAMTQGLEITIGH